MPSPIIYNDAPSYCHPFFDLVKGDDLLLALRESGDATRKLFESIPEPRAKFTYAEGKWTIADVLQHIIDCERVYAYRAFRFSRFDTTPLEGFSEDDYIRNSSKTTPYLTALLDEFLAIRRSTILLYEPMSDEMLDFAGTANGHRFTARSLGFMAAGHNLHHLSTIRERYLK